MKSVKSQIIKTPRQLTGDNIENRISKKTRGYIWSNLSMRIWDQIIVGQVWHHVVDRIKDQILESKKGKFSEIS
jgi:hypothetical protein